MNTAISDKTNYPLLRLSQTSVGEDQHAFDITLEMPSQARQTATSIFTFTLSKEDQESIRWYLEDYFQYPQDPAPTIAARVEQRMLEIGKQLFNGVFQSRDALKLWSRFQPHVVEARIEIATTIRDATTIPWELLCDPDTNTPLALCARVFVRTHTQPARPTITPNAVIGPVRILLAICRPSAGDDVPFRSVASRIIKGLNKEARSAFQIDVLRPPTFEQLAITLRRAKMNGQPYQIVHFDGHGDYIEHGGINPLLLNSPRVGSHGYLVFENPAVAENMQLVDGAVLGCLLVETNTPILVLNACRSAHAEADPVSGQVIAADIHAEVRAYGTLAQEVMDQGVVGVVAMRYNVYVVTAAQFVADLYAALASGQSLGEAVSLGRKQLATQPLRGIICDARPLQDWVVPVVYEATSLALFSASQGKQLTIALRSDNAAFKTGEEFDLPATPDAGFWGRDETLLALDRAFDTQTIVLLHAYAGAGKTATVAEFARWYALTDGIDGPILFTSFERYLPLPRVLDTIGRVFGPALERSGTHWLTLNDVQRREVALQILNQVSVLWIWDNIEPVSGFPNGSASAWTPEEQLELLSFLRAARGTKAKFLLTSRRDEQAWLADLAARVILPPMFMQERVELAQALALKRGKMLTAVHNLRPLLEFTGGNPHALTVVVSHAFREGLVTPQQVEAFVERLRTGEANFPNETSEGCNKSLGASLNYGLDNTFSEGECRQLALLYIFQGFVQAGVLCLMGDPKRAHHLPELRGISLNEATQLLNKAAEIGLLTRKSENRYCIHPAVPWFFRRLYKQHHPTNGTANDTAFAFGQVMAFLGDLYRNEYDLGRREVIRTLSDEESNLLFTRQIGLQNGWWFQVIGAMQGLRTLYTEQGRWAEWERLIDGIVPFFIDPITSSPLNNCDEHWELVMEYRVQILRQKRNWQEAERLHRIRLKVTRRNAAAALTKTKESLSANERHVIRCLSVALHYLGEMQQETNLADCVETYKEAVRLAELCDAQNGAAICEFSLARAFSQKGELRDLDKAEYWCKRSLARCKSGDGIAKGKCLSALTVIALERFEDGRKRKIPEDQLESLLNSALNFCEAARLRFPIDDYVDLGIVYHHLGGIFHSYGRAQQAKEAYREAIWMHEKTNNIQAAGQVRGNMAIILAREGSLKDARDYATASLSDFETQSDKGGAEGQKIRCLLAKIERDLDRAS